uniref:NADH-ubiquinone oxidoreductase chain 4L n=1 Tax=Atelura formicaria TaxID=459531 RepID=B5KME2_9INSE|nr:NADH dehydrogenase subunit 4L [Atelura formicaria]ABS88985.1 NADH dehydrogenase subunit 4L [Atelura formicaria]
MMTLLVQGWGVLPIIVGGMVVYVSRRKHLLITLLSLEFIVLGMYCFMLGWLEGVGHEMYFSLLFLTMSVCEGTLGLSVLVSMIRTHGNDYFEGFSIIQC